MLFHQTKMTCLGAGIARLLKKALVYLIHRLTSPHIGRPAFVSVYLLKNYQFYLSGSVCTQISICKPQAALLFLSISLP